MAHCDDEDRSQKLRSRRWFQSALQTVKPLILYGDSSFANLTPRILKPVDELFVDFKVQRVSGNRANWKLKGIKRDSDGN
uniref:Uncharacterized protein n=1 Tax=Helianthus annuus TaxID=4232 RepID=A0A251U0Y4_HELAN